MEPVEYKTPKQEIDARLDRLRRHLENDGTDCALVLQNSDLFYFSGTAQQATLYVPVDGDAVLMVKKNFQRAADESPVERIVSVKSPRDVAAIVGNPRVIGMELDVMPASVYLGMARTFEKSTVVDVSRAIRSIRAVKSEYEIGIIRRCAELSDRLAAFVPTVLLPGMSEIELAALIEAEARRLGHQGLVRMRSWNGELFYGHIMAGASAAVPSSLASPTGGMGTTPAFPQGSGYHVIREHEPVLVDVAFAHMGYISDHTRIYAVGGLSDDLLAAHNAMLEIQELLKHEAVPGASAGDLYNMATDLAERFGYEDNFMGSGHGRIRFVGHGVGIELDEYPVIAKGQGMVLKEGMVVAIEPKAVFPGRGVVGIENTHLVTAGGLEQLGHYTEAVVIV